MTTEEKVKAYDEALKKIHEIITMDNHLVLPKEIGEYLFPQLRESEDERIRKEIIDFLETIPASELKRIPRPISEWFFYLEKQKNKKYEMIQWTGDNLNEVIEFTGKSPMFEKWFKSWEEYEEYVHSHGNVFKLFNDDGSHYEAPVSAWIVKTPDGNKVFSEVIKLFT